MKLWIARDKDGYLGLYEKYPTWVQINEFKKDWAGHFKCSLPENTFPEITFENSPQQVKLELINKL